MAVVAKPSIGTANLDDRKDFLIGPCYGPLLGSDGVYVLYMACDGYTRLHVRGPY